MIVNREDLKFAEVSERNALVGFTSGAFDLLHVGHVRFLQEAKRRCDLLAVGVNSDASVKLSKGDARPIIGQQARAEIVSALSCVDYVFLFDEKTNRENILALKPDRYFKAGDYTKESLSSAPLVESYGGRVEIIPAEDKGENSTSEVIKRIVRTSGFFAFPAERSKRKVLFLDRDGTIVKSVPYLHEPEKVELLPGTISGMCKFRDAGFDFVMVTNQPGIGLGFYEKEDFFETTLRIFSLLSPHGLLFRKVYFSPYSMSEASPCRKPATGLVERACQDLDIDLPNSLFVGDQSCDVQCGKNAGCLTASIGRSDLNADYHGSTLDEIFEAWRNS